ncbi:flagellin domain-containing protein [Paracidovorax wautersii]|uniref:Flagellin n=1 Tax=Paracidovorax wautersii TaxID=1177982 RepID=A0ABU1IBF4_9BURK|nr:flagellin domain-containing protein [Paracidovorax wautersii]MDR6214112.1 flagellin [Paracidovorax wautersii]
MASTINTNLASLNAQRNLSTSQLSLATSMQRLSSGLRVNSAKDDAAGLAIAERMNTQVRGMNVAIRNSNDGISLAQTAEGALGKISDNLQRMRELAVQAANDTNGGSDRTALDNEFKQLAAENARVIANTKFNGQPLLTGSGGTGGTFTFQVGANTGADNQISITTSAIATSMGAVTQGTTSAATLGITATTARAAMDAIDTALTAINGARSTFGASQNRFEAVISNLQVASENQAAARGRIMDADFAAETANLSRAQILQQAGTAMVAQANQIPQTVLQLLQG